MLVTKHPTGETFPSLQNVCLRRILNILNKVTNIEDFLKRRRWTYLGHVLRMPEYRLPNTVYEWRPEGRRKRGRPRHTLRRQYRDLSNAEMSLQPQWEDSAQLWDIWRGFVDTLCATPGSGGSKVYGPINFFHQKPYWLQLECYTYKIAAVYNHCCFLFLHQIYLG